MSFAELFVHLLNAHICFQCGISAIQCRTLWRSFECGGDVVWFDFVQSGSFGDTRKLKGADEAVKKILKNLPNS